MSKKMRVALSKLLVVAMIIQMAIPIPVRAAEETMNGTVSGNGYLGEEIAMIAENGKAVNMDGGEVLANAAVTQTDTGVKVVETADFTITKKSDAEFYAVNNTKINKSLQLVNFDYSADLKVSVHDGQQNAEALNESAWEGLKIEEADGGQYYLTTTARYNYNGGKTQLYAVVDPVTDALGVTPDVAQASKFTFVLVSETTVPPSTDFTIKHVGTGKLVKTYDTENKPLTVDGEAGDEGTVFKSVVYMDYDNGDLNEKYVVASFISKDYSKGIKSSVWVDSGYDAVVKVHGTDSIGGWESIVVVPNGDGTVSFMDSRFKKYITVNDDGQLEGRLIDDYTRDDLTDNEKFIIQLEMTPKEIKDLTVDPATRTTTSLTLNWTNPKSIYTGQQLFMKGPEDLDFKKIADLSDESSYTVTGLTPGREYSFKLLTINGRGEANDTGLSVYSNETSAVTRANEKPATPGNVRLQKQDDGTYLLSWDPAEHAESYKIMRAPSMFGEYTEVGTTAETSSVVTLDGDRYANYFRVVAVNVEDDSDESDFVSLERNLFGDHTIIFAPTDDTARIDDTIEKLFKQQNDISADAQFKGEQWQIYFKPGDYTDAACMNLGFYTSFSGLGKTPYDVRLNNIAIPAYLSDNNATCNFWRSTENVSIINTGNEQGKAQYGSWRGDWFNWAVAQAAPLRRVYTERPIAYDWNYGWASGGYVADSILAGIDGEGNSAGTWSGQQFYTRNATVSGNVFGTTLNNFFQGVVASNLPDADGATNGTARALQKGNGYSNWKLPNAEGDQQVFTNVETTPRIAEKPFLYLDDDGEYAVFVPAVKENTKGVSWSEDNMGEGTSLPLSDFYIAKPSDTAAQINAQLAAGKNIYFTPGTYHAEEPIKVERKDTILLGTGMASIIPDNAEAAMQIADVDGVRIAGLIFDAGAHSRYLLVVGEKESHIDHSADPIILQDLFFRVGGTTDTLTKADDALEINADDTICDHFWIWRADHGAGVEWYGNVSKHGLIVNGDDVTCYALFNEHFQEYHTLWNGENGETYFYQNETCYDPISQEAWMSHNGTVNGYASYKVADEVENHYAVGLGVYNVFIYTGPTYDSTEVQIVLDNAIEVPDKEGVLIENACMQTFADENKVLQKIKSVVNGKGDPVSSGKDPVTGETGTSWDRTFLLYYCNGETEGSSREVRKLYEELKDFYESHKNDEQPEDVSDEDWEAFMTALGEVKEKLDEGVPVSVSWPIESEAEQYSEALNTLENTQMDLVVTDEQMDDVKTSLSDAIAEAASVSENNYTATSWTVFEKALDEAKTLAESTEDAEYSKYFRALEALRDAQNALVTKAEELTAVRGTLSDVLKAAGQLQETDYTEESWAVFARAFEDAGLLRDDENATATEITAAVSALTNAQKALVKGDGQLSNEEPEKPVDPKPEDSPSTVGKGGSDQSVNSGANQTDAGSGDKGSGDNKVTPSVKLNATSIPLQVGKSTTALKITQKTPSNDKVVKWTSSNKKIVTVTKKGKIKAKKAGTAYVTVTMKSGAKAKCKVKVQKKKVTTKKLTIDAKKVSVKVKKKVQLNVARNPITATEKIKWTTSNKKVATVTGKGKVTGKKAGKATITAKTTNGKKIKFTVTVKK